MLSPALIWFLVGVVFLVLEMAAPGFILIFFAAGGWTTAVVTWQLGIGLTYQIVVFIGSSIVLLFALRKIGMKTFKGETRKTTDDLLNDVKIGKTAVVTQTIAYWQSEGTLF